MGGRYIQCFLYTRSPGKPNDHQYAHPLDMVVNLDMNIQRVTDIWMQQGDTCKVPQQNSNYHRQLMNKQWRDPPKPLDIVQVRLRLGHYLFLQTFGIIGNWGPCFHELAAKEKG